jgi:hypothetical protein
LLYECNQEGLIFTQLDFHSLGADGAGVVTFTPEATISENLYGFGDQIMKVV